jgi:hypothetical protein
MTTQEQQQLVDVVMQKTALRRGSSTRRDFEVACLTVGVLLARLRIGSGNQHAEEHAQATGRSAAQKESCKPCDACLILLRQPPRSESVEQAKAELLSALAAVIAHAKRHGETAHLLIPDDYIEEIDALIATARAQGRASADQTILRQQQEQERIEKRPICPSCKKATTISQLLQYGACCDCSEDAPYDSEAI